MPGKSEIFLVFIVSYYDDEDGEFKLHRISCAGLRAENILRLKIVIASLEAGAIRDFYLNRCER